MTDPIDQLATISQAESSAAATEVFNSVKVSLADLCAKGTAQYAHKNYEEAAELYSRASELQSELNGEMSPENAEILFLYGRSLFKVGQGKSDVLGGRAGGEKKKPTGTAKPKKAEAVKEEATTEAGKTIEEGVAIIAQENGGSSNPANGTDAKKPLFQFTGDENFEDSDDEEAEEGDGEPEEEEDDLAAAYEILDLARVLFGKKLEAPEEEEAEGKGKGRPVEELPMVKHIKERLADTHDLLAEISLENERFPGAVTDFRAALQHKQELYPEESEIIAEAHFKLSLALEFASVSKAKDEDDQAEPTTGSEEVDQNLRDEAVKELEAAINSTKLKLQNKEVELASVHSPDDNDVTRDQIAEVKEIVADMEHRLAELKGPAINMKDALYGPEAIGGVLGTALGESTAEAAARIEDAKKGATDLTGLIKRKKPAEPSSSSNSTNGKRKADDDAEEKGDAKKVKVVTVEDVAEE